MAEFSIQIAGQVAAVRSLFDSTRDYCRHYLTEKTPDLSITVTRQDLEFEQEFALEEARQEGFRPRIFTDPFLERAAIQRKMADHLFLHDVLLFHGSAVAVDGRGYLFTARSGTGKSTHTRLWCQTFAHRAVMINDDKPFLRISEDGVLVCGAPWSGKHGLDTNITVPLQGICILERGTKDRIRPITAEEALPMLRKQGCPPLDPGCRDRFEAMTAQLSRLVPLWQMDCTRESAAALTAHRAMSGQET